MVGQVNKRKVEKRGEAPYRVKNEEKMWHLTKLPGPIQPDAAYV